MVFNCEDDFFLAVEAPMTVEAGCQMQLEPAENIDKHTGGLSVLMLTPAAALVQFFTALCYVYGMLNGQVVFWGTQEDLDRDKQTFRIL